MGSIAGRAWRRPQLRDQARKAPDDQAGAGQRQHQHGDQSRAAQSDQGPIETQQQPIAGWWSHGRHWSVAMEESSAENVADYPRPPALRASHSHVLVRALGELLCETHHALQVLETFHPPTYYLPPDSIALNRLEPVPGRSLCEWKGVAHYFDLVVGTRRIERALWHYPEPTAAFAALAGWFALYPAQMDGYWVDGERVRPQQGGFYDGWITSAVSGPFKGDPLHPELI